MNISFSFRVYDKTHFVFHSHSVVSNKNYELLSYVFSCNVFFDHRGNIEQRSLNRWHWELLEEIEQIELGNLDRNEEAGLVDLSNPGELIIYKDKTILIREEEGKYLELPTSEFKGLIKAWIKFVEINTQAFSQNIEKTS